MKYRPWMWLMTDIARSTVAPNMMILFNLDVADCIDGYLFNILTLYIHVLLIFLLMHVRTINNPHANTQLSFYPN
jgi:hypothetical protein